MVYFLGWLLNYVSFSLWSLFPLRAFFLFSFVFAGPLVFFRNSGTDVALYEAILLTLAAGEENVLTRGIEPGFTFFSKVFLWLTGSEVWALRWIGASFVFLLLVYIFRANRAEVSFFSLYFFPVFFYQYGMNAVRAGLGVAILLLAWQALRRRKMWVFVSLSALSLLFHYSMVVPVALLLFFALPTRKRVIFLGLFGFLGLILLSLRWEYFTSKLSLYSSYDSPSEVSGLSRLLIMAVLWLFFAMTKIPLRVKFKRLLVLIGMSFAFQILALYSYAGLRFLDLMAFITPLILIDTLEREQGRVSKLFLIGLALAGLLGMGFVYRNFLNESVSSDILRQTPFLPYRTVFEK
ncbi:MAG: EpsG family protein [Thermaceae bacterium]